MTPKFRAAIQLILDHEGGYVNDPADPGGETRYGISKRSYPNTDIKSLTIEAAQEIYYRDYWKKMRCDDLPIGVATLVFDFGVNAGVDRSIKMLQKILGLKPDGSIGPVTLNAISKLHPHVIVEKLTAERILYYTSLKQWTLYGKGWLHRSISTMGFCLKIREI